MDNVGNILMANPNFMLLATQIGNGRQWDAMPKLMRIVTKLVLLARWNTNHENQSTMEFEEYSEDKDFRIWGTLTRVGGNTLCTVQGHLMLRALLDVALMNDEACEAMIETIERNTPDPNTSWAKYKKAHKLYVYHEGTQSEITGLALV